MYAPTHARARARDTRPSRSSRAQVGLGGVELETMHLDFGEDGACPLRAQRARALSLSRQWRWSCRARRSRARSAFLHATCLFKCVASFAGTAGVWLLGCLRCKWPLPLFSQILVAIAAIIVKRIRPPSDRSCRRRTPWPTRTSPRRRCTAAVRPLPRLDICRARPLYRVLALSSCVFAARQAMRIAEAALLPERSGTGVGALSAGRAIDDSKARAAAATRALRVCTLSQPRTRSRRDVLRPAAARVRRSACPALRDAFGAAPPALAPRACDACVLCGAQADALLDEAVQALSEEPFQRVRRGGGPKERHGSCHDISAVQQQWRRGGGTSALARACTRTHRFGARRRSNGARSRMRKGLFPSLAPLSSPPTLHALLATFTR
eukprot:4417276-Pleurochrysis_carterae.AAC.2